MNSRIRTRLLWALGIFVGVVLALWAGAAWYLRSKNVDELTRKWVVEALAEKFQSNVALASLHVGVFPRMEVVGEGLVLHLRGRADVPPLIQIKKFRFVAGFSGIFRSPHHIHRIFLDQLVITVPPREGTPPKEKAPPSEPKKDTVIIDTIECTDADLIMLPKEANKEPLDWDIHDLVLTAVGVAKPFSFHGILTNAKPKGEIDTTGQFGPWQAEDPGLTPVSGAYKFSQADLGPFPGIAGTLSSTGKYDGVLNELAVIGETDMPDFSLDNVGKPVPLHTDYDATVDGTNGDTLLHPVNAVLVKSKIVANGSVIQVPNEGHLIKLDVTTPDARIEDMLMLAMNTDTPFLRGPVDVKAKLTIPPGKVKVIDKIILDGSFNVKNGRWQNAEIREKLESLSRHAEGKPGDEGAGSSLTNLRGRFVLKDGKINFSSLLFSVPGADVDLTGTYNIRGGDMDFAGHLTMQAKLSQAVGGVKSFFLKAVDPFFAKNGAGAVVPIKITGTKDDPKFGLALFGSGKDDNKNDKKKNEKDSGSERKSADKTTN